MLDYVANGTEYWNMDRLRQAAAETAQSLGTSLDEEIQRLTGAEGEVNVEAYWEEVEENLREGKVRLLFVTDETPRELRRLVEFLNSKMQDIEVLAVEVKQFLGQDGQRAVVPRVIGQTEEARRGKGPRPKNKRLSGADEFLASCDPTAVEFFTHVIELAKQRRHILYWGEKGFSVRAKFPDGKIYSFVYGWPWDQFDFYLGFPVSDDKESSLRKHLLDSGIFAESGKKTLKAEITSEKIKQLKEAYNFILGQIDSFIGPQSSAEPPI